MGEDVVDGRNTWRQVFDIVTAVETAESVERLPTKRSRAIERYSATSGMISRPFDLEFGYLLVVPNTLSNKRVTRWWTST
jgi:hypothetical protein